MIDVLAGVVADALLSFRDQLVTLAELRCACRTDFGAGGGFALCDAIWTHGALLHLGHELAPFIFRNTEGAGHHAVAASHAFGRIVGDGPERGFLERADGTN